MSRTPRTAVTATMIAALAGLSAACSHSAHHSSASSALETSAGASSALGSRAPSPAASSSAASAPGSAAAGSAAANSAAATAAASTKAAPTTKASTTASAKPSPVKTLGPVKPTPTPQPTVTARAPQPPVGGTASGSDVLAGTSCQIFPADNYWHADVRSLPVDSHSAAWMSAMGSATRKLHPDFGPSGGAMPYGIPITIAKAGHARVPVAFQYADESDTLAYPLGADTLIEGGANSGGDQHAIVVTADTCELFETWDTSNTASGWTAGSGAHWLLSSDALRPNTWTSADAAGLPILPGLLRWSEVAAGHVNHAIRFTTNTTDDSYLWPARHAASSNHNANLPPMGARFRLKSTFSLAGYSAQAQVVLRAMQTYGLVLADNGSPWYFQGDASTGWPDALIESLKTIPANAFEAVNTSGLEITANSGAAR